MRINKFIARCGICSRREAEKLIEAGKITINGKISKDLATKILDTDIVKYQNKILAISASELYLFHKPSGYLTSNFDPEGRATIYKLLPEKLQNFKYVGRLDLNSEGLLLLTNDGELKRNLELPSNEFKRVYKVRIFGKLSPEHKKKLESGITIKNIKYRPMKIKILRAAVNSWLEITICEGKNREIRRCLEHFDYQVNRLIRISYGKYSLGNLIAGRVALLSEVNHANNCATS